MKEIKKKRCKETLSVQNYRMMPSHRNSSRILFIGQSLCFLDKSVSITQSRFTNHSNSSMSVPLTA